MTKCYLPYSERSQLEKNTSSLMQLLITHEENDFIYIATMVDFHALVSPVALKGLQGKGASDEYLF